MMSPDTQNFSLQILNALIKARHAIKFTHRNTIYNQTNLIKLKRCFFSLFQPNMPTFSLTIRSWQKHKVHIILIDALSLSQMRVEFANGAFVLQLEIPQDPIDAPLHVLHVLLAHKLTFIQHIDYKNQMNKNFSKHKIAKKEKAYPNVASAQ